MSLKILTVNCWFLPFPFSLDKRKRFLNLIRLINQEEPDIVALQEVLSKRQVGRLRKEFVSYFIFSSGKGFFNEGGLVTMFKLKPLRVSTKFFPRCKEHNMLELIAHKGYQKAELLVGREKFLFINTHIYAPIVRAKRKIAFEQFKILKNASKDKNVILVGDLNIREKHIKELNNGFFQYKQSAKVSTGFPNRYKKFFFHRFEANKGKVDYVLIRFLKKEVKVDKRSIKHYLISDHFPILAKLYL